MKARIRHTSKIVDVVPHGHGWDYKENKPGTGYECFMAQDLDFEGIEENHPVTFASGTRQLKDITDAELTTLVELSGMYGVKQFWGDIKVTEIDRMMFSNCICIDYEQTRIKDDEVAESTMFFNYNELSYHVHHKYPYERSSECHSVCEKTQMVLWLIAQGFNLLELLTYAPVDPHGEMSRYTVGYLVGNRHTDWFDLEHAKYFCPEQKKEAKEYTDVQKPRQRMYRLVDERLHENNDNEVNIDKVCNWMQQHGITSHVIESFKKDMEG